LDELERGVYEKGFAAMSATMTSNIARSKRVNREQLLQLRLSVRMLGAVPRERRELLRLWRQKPNPEDERRERGGDEQPRREVLGFLAERGVARRVVLVLVRSASTAIIAPPPTHKTRRARGASCRRVGGGRRDSR